MKVMAIFQAIGLSNSAPTINDLYYNISQKITTNCTISIGESNMVSIKVPYERPRKENMLMKATAAGTALVTAAGNDH